MKFDPKHPLFWVSIVAAVAIGIVVLPIPTLRIKFELPPPVHPSWDVHR